MTQVAASGIAACDAFYRQLIRKVDIQQPFGSSFAMERIEYTTELPLDYAK